MRHIRIIAIVLCVAATAALSSCRVRIDDEAAFFAEVADLIERSAEVNELFFGEGLPYVDPDGLTADEIIAAEGNDIISRTTYRPVAEDAKYRTQSEIMDLTRSVYSEKYADSLYSLGFEGVSSEEGAVAVYARYIYTLENGLTINMYSVANARKLTRTFDTTTLAIDRLGRDYAVVSLEAYDDGESAGRVQLRVNKESSGWRLDWPTY